MFVSEAGEKRRDDFARLGHEVVDVLRCRILAEALLEQSAQVGQECVHFAADTRQMSRPKDGRCDVRGIDAELRESRHSGVELVADGHKGVADLALGDLRGAPHLQRGLHAPTGFEEGGDGGGYVTDSANLSVVVRYEARLEKRGKD